jgi:hypothetical protein
LQEGWKYGTIQANWGYPENLDLIAELGSQERAIPLFKAFMAASTQAAIARVLHPGCIGEGEDAASSRVAERVIKFVR